LADQEGLWLSPFFRSDALGSNKFKFYEIHFLPGFGKYG
jgi:hypothetical protein